MVVMTERRQQMTPFDLSTSLFHLLHRAAQTADDLFEGSSKQKSLTSRQFIVLAAIAQNDGLSQTQIVELTGIDRSTMAEIVLRLKRKGLIGRQRNRLDARAYSVRITAPGRQEYETAARLAKQAEARLETSMSAMQTAQLVRLLQTFVSVTADGKNTK